MAQEIERTEHLFGTTPDEKISPMVRAKREENERRFIKDLKEELKKKKEQEDELIISEEAVEQDQGDDQQEPPDEKNEPEPDKASVDETESGAGERIDLKA